MEALYNFTPESSELNNCQGALVLQLAIQVKNFVYEVSIIIVLCEFVESKSIARNIFEIS